MGRPTYRVIHGNCKDVLPLLGAYDTAFIDPPDGIKLGYDVFKDRWASQAEYADWLYGITAELADMAWTVWVSYNAKHDIPYKARLVAPDSAVADLEMRTILQTFTFGQDRRTDLTNNYRPLLRLRYEDAPLYPKAIKVPSWRMLNGDKRARRGGKVPGDVWDFPRVTGNSKQRRRWHPTQLHESLVERALLFSTPTNGSVIDCFGGTGTTLRVAKRLGLSCTIVEFSRNYCKRICQENSVPFYEFKSGRIRKVD